MATGTEGAGVEDGLGADDGGAVVDAGGGADDEGAVGAVVFFGSAYSLVNILQDFISI